MHGKIITMEYEAMGGESVRIMKTLCANMYSPIIGPASFIASLCYAIFRIYVFLSRYTL